MEPEFNRLTIDAEAYLYVKPQTPDVWTVCSWILCIAAVGLIAVLII